MQSEEVLLLASGIEMDHHTGGKGEIQRSKMLTGELKEVAHGC